jgi:lysophospholipase L1-like esterase
MKPAGDFLMGAALLRAMGVPISAILKQTVAAPPQISASDAHLQYWGRWDLRNTAESGAVTVNTGSTLILAFRGIGATLHFATNHYPQQLPTLWLQVDDQEWRVVNPAADLPVSRQALPEADHIVRVVVKGFREWERRWDPPLESSVVFRGLSLDPGASLLEPPPRPARLIEYVGDSITEGVLVLTPGDEARRQRERWPQYSDGRRTWAYQSALALGAEPRIAGFGRLGLTIHGNGGVPAGTYSFPFIYGGVPVDKSKLPDAVVVNMGTNDRRAPADVFEPLYRQYIETIRREYAGTVIFCIQPFAGSHGEEIERVVEALRRAGDSAVHYVPTSGWIDTQAHTTDTLHLNLEGNRVAAERLVPILKRGLGLE